MRYSYTVTTKGGRIRKGIVEAPSREDAENSLLEQDLEVISIKRNGSKKGLSKLSFSFRGRISTTDRIFFVRHLAALIKSGISLVESLEVIRGETPSASLNSIIKSIIASINNGNSLSNSLSRHPKAFDGLFVHVVSVGEKSGTLEQNLEYIALQLEKARDLKRKLIAAMIYPAIIFSLAVVVASGLIIFILPRLLPVFASFDVELPITTKILIGISRYFQNFGLVTLFGIAGLAILLRALASFPPIMFVLSKITLFIPILGPIKKNLNLAFLARTMETLTRSGISVVEATEIAGDSLGSMVYRSKLRSFSAELKEGRRLGNIFEKEKFFFPISFSRMVGVGERSGRLEESFLYLAEFYEKEVDNLTTNLSNVLQPILLVVVGFVVGFIAIAIITPIYKFTESIHR